MRKGEVSQTTNLVREGQLEFLLDLYERGIPIGQEEEELLIRHKLIRPKTAKKPPKQKAQREVEAELHKTETQRRADKYINVIEGEDPFPGTKRHVILDSETYDKLAETNLFHYEGGREITRDDWAPEDKIYHSEDFVNWINAINNKGFQAMTRYKPFAMYCQQAEDWLNEGLTIGSFDTNDEKREFAISEIDRCKENTLYALDKYLDLKEGDMTGGNRKYRSKPVHKVICYLIDCGYSFMMGKPRQIAATSTLGGIALIKLITNKNYFIKFITQDKETGEEIFEDKIKYPFGELPKFLKPSVSNDRDNLFRLSRKTDSKGTKGGVNSKFQIVAPSGSAINGGSPQLVMVDEAGYIKILGRMIKEARPTMFMMNDKTGKLEMKRQIVVWGTGGEMDKGGKAYETEFHDALKHWNEGNFENGMIPIFFDWTTRPGITKEFYLNEKKVYTVEGPDKEAKMVQFRQAYPSIIEDMFLTSSKLLVGIDWINAQVERLRNEEHTFRPVHGYFEPIYDTSKPSDEHSDTPFKIIGATFVPLDDLKDDMRMASCMLLMHPKKGWKNRYYQGTDPIMSDNGYSNMGSAIYDARYNTPVCIMNYRDPKHHYTFLQCMLMGIYYDTNNEGGIPELVESNIGTAYIDYKTAKGFDRNIVQRLELPDHMQGGGHLYGIDNKGNRNMFIITKLREMLFSYGDRLRFMVIFEQLRTFVCTFTEKGNETWGTADARYFRDDVLFGLVFSYICRMSFVHRDPIDLSNDKSQVKTVWKLVRDKNGELTRVPTQVRV